MREKKKRPSRRIWFQDNDGSPRHIVSTDSLTPCSTTFEVGAHLKHGETLIIVGDATDLGSWNSAQGIQLHTSPTRYPTWEVVIPLNCGTEINYKYAIKLNGSFSRWEGISGNRKLKTPKHGTLIVKDTLNLGSENETIDKASNRSTMPHAEISGVFSENDGFVIVMHSLPVIIEQDRVKDRWIVNWDPTSLFSRKESTSADNARLHFVGCPNFKYPDSIVFSPPRTGLSQESLTHILKKFRCIPIFIDPSVHDLHFHEFGRKRLRKVMFGVLDVYFPGSDNEFSNQFWMKDWLAYLKVNQVFCDKLIENFCEGDIVWIQVYDGYELLLLPSLLQRKVQGKLHLGIMINSVWASSDIFKSLPQREALLRGILSADNIGFHAYEDARKFVICCSRTFGAEYHFSDGKIIIDFEGRKVTVSISNAGISTKYFENVFQGANTSEIDLYNDVKSQFPKGRKVMLGVDKLDGFSGVGLKLLAFKKLVEVWPKSIVDGKLVFDSYDGMKPPVMLQVVRPTKDIAEKSVGVVEDRFKTAKTIAKQINDYCQATHVIIMEEEDYEVRRAALFSTADILISTPTRQGPNQLVAEFLIAAKVYNKVPILILSEFAEVSRSMVGSLKVNPWKLESMLNVMNMALFMSEGEKLLRFKADIRFVTTNNFSKWINLVLADLKLSRDLDKVVSTGLGFGHSYRNLGFRPDFKALDTEKLSKRYKGSLKRLILLDFTGTIVPPSDSEDVFPNSGSSQAHNRSRISSIKSNISSKNNIEIPVELEHSPDSKEVPMPTAQMMSSLKALCNDRRNTVFIISERQKSDLAKALGKVDNLGLVAEHGFYFAWPSDSASTSQHRDWEITVEAIDGSWINLVHGVMSSFTQQTTNSNIKKKGSTILWDYSETEGDFGHLQAIELTENLSQLLKPFPVEVFHGKHYVDVHPFGCGKGKACEQIISRYCQNEKFPNFILSIGDDTSDEHMFTYLRSLRGEQVDSAENPFATIAHLKNTKVRTVVVGRKPSSANFYVQDQKEVEHLISALGKISNRQQASKSMSDLADLTESSSKISGWGKRTSFTAEKRNTVSNQMSLSAAQSMAQFKTLHGEIGESEFFDYSEEAIFF